MKREPTQARSIASTNRMLDAAESLLERGGPDALTVEAVVQESASSTGSFYARFGDRQGLLIAVQDRFLDSLGASLSEAFGSLPADSDLPATIESVVTAFLDAFRTHRSAFVAFMLINRSEPSMRARGAVASRDASKAIARLFARHEEEIAHPDTRMAADFAYRVLFALATQTVMFEDFEVSAHRYPPGSLEREAARLLCAYLQSPVESDRGGIGATQDSLGPEP